MKQWYLKTSGHLQCGRKIWWYVYNSSECGRTTKSRSELTSPLQRAGVWTIITLPGHPKASTLPKCPDSAATFDCLCSTNETMTPSSTYHVSLHHHHHNEF
ncbi:hypothetical protein PoB_004109700 [Plakobranchus ocellatus]|uniref:Uncharacterized protein n=1 Tax=Plakobranchus ocellatus TaxID=259542 RepID=A0AAV4B5Y5_9GAST|nr:hypothetical protein PoB_004109700 [Plakobranchus ocellatus]